MTDVDVLVVGAGPTGLTLAGELLRRGVRARLVDKADAPTTLSKAIAVHARTLEILADLGAADALVARGVEVRGAILSAEGKTLASVDFDALDTLYPFVLSVSQAETEAVLRDVLVTRGGAIDRGAEVTSVAPEADGVTVVLRSARGEETVRASWLVGCDGAHSAVRHALGASFDGHPYDEVFVLADVRIDWSAPTDRISTAFAEDGIAAAFPMKDGRWRVIVTASPAIAAGEVPTLEALQEITERRTRVKAPLSDCVWIAPFKIHCRQVESYRHGRVFLAGDAAHVHSPAGGQGMNTGIQDAHNLAWKLALVQRGLAKDTLLDSYGAERHAIGKALLRATDVATKVGTLRGDTTTALRNHVARFATSFEPVKRRLVQSIAELDVGYPESPIAKEHVASVLRARIGDPASAESPTVASHVEFQRGPRPGARAPDGVVVDARTKTTTRLSKLWDSRAFTLLLFDGRSATPAGYASLAGIAAWATKKWGALVVPWLVTPRAELPENLPDDLAVLLDEGELEARYAARTECLYLIRPDLYVGFRSQPADLDALARYLDAILV